MITAEQVDTAPVDTAPVDTEQEVAALCGVLNASYARLVTIVARALVDESWAIGGVRSPEHWLIMRAGLSPFHARQVVTVARRCEELPTVMEQFAKGQLSLDQVSVVARYAPAHVEESVAELAVNASVPQLRRALSRYSFDPPTPQKTGRLISEGDTESDDTQPDDTNPDNAASGATDPGNAASSDINPGNAASSGTDAGDAEPANTESDVAEPAAEAAGDPPTWNGFALADDRATAPPELSISHDEDGRFTLRFTAPADLGALVEAALKEAKDALFHAGQPKATMGDALVEIAKRSLGAVESVNRRDAYRTYVHLDTEGAWLNGKPRLPKHVAEKLTCDGILQPVWHTQGAPVNVGRAQRIVPARTRRLVEDRDRGCRYPGCVATAHVECHHIIHWVDGGPTDTWNLAGLCPFHHDAHHDGDFTITGNADDPLGLTFTTRQGFPIPHGPTFTSPTSAPAPRAPAPGSPASASPPVSPASPESMDSSGSSLGSKAPPETRYRGPTGDRLNLRWVTFHEPENPRSADDPDDQPDAGVDRRLRHGTTRVGDRRTSSVKPAPS